MKKVVGFAMFWFAAGMFTMLMISRNFLGVLIMFACLILGYQLFCCD